MAPGPHDRHPPKPKDPDLNEDAMAHQLPRPQLVEHCKRLVERLQQNGELTPSEQRLREAYLDVVIALTHLRQTEELLEAHIHVALAKMRVKELIDEIQYEQLHP